MCVFAGCARYNFTPDPEGVGDVYTTGSGCNAEAWDVGHTADGQSPA